MEERYYYKILQVKELRHVLIGFLLLSSYAGGAPEGSETSKIISICHYFVFILQKV